MGLDKGVAALDVAGETQALWGTGDSFWQLDVSSPGIM